MTARRLLDSIFTSQPYCERHHILESAPMLRRDPRNEPAAIPDRELGIAALLLLITVVLTAIVVPGIA
jgi:hypothetical protein